MADEAPQGSREEHFSWTRLVPADEEARLRDPEFSVYLIQVKSDTDIGRSDLTDPLTLFREKIPEMELPEDVRATVVRINAEVPANPVHRSAVWVVHKGAKSAAGVLFKHHS
jgi:hypothetical protein